MKVNINGDPKDLSKGTVAAVVIGAFLLWLVLFLIVVVGGGALMGWLIMAALGWFNIEVPFWICWIGSSIVILLFVPRS